MMKTALITGASGGIGWEFAKIFAQKQVNLILVARNETRLREIANDLSKNGIDAKFYAKDLSKIENAIELYNDIKYKNIVIDYVINNAGFGINNEYTDISWEKELEMFNLNMLTLAYFTKVFAKDMKQRGYGRILNVGSTGSFQPGPYMAGYCATKAFILNLSEAINYELKGTGVSVTTLCPGVTNTSFSDVAGSNNNLLVKMTRGANPSGVAKYGFKIMMKGKYSGIPGFMNKLMVFSNRFVSRKLITITAGRLLHQ